MAERYGNTLCRRSSWSAPALPHGRGCLIAPKCLYRNLILVHYPNIFGICIGRPDHRCFRASMSCRDHLPDWRQRKNVNGQYYAGTVRGARR